MDLIEEMLPIFDEDYIIWCLYGRPSDALAQEKFFLRGYHAECEAEIQRMAVKNPDGIRADSKEGRFRGIQKAHDADTTRQSSALSGTPCVIS